MTDRFSIQASRYAFPYHWLTSFGPDGRTWSLDRELRWGLEHLGVLHTALLTIAGLRPAAVLDVGCGDGRLVHELLELGVPRVEGVDLAPQAIAFAKAFLGNERAALVQCCPADAAPSGPFDVVSMVEVLEHVPEGELPLLLGALHERLRPDGHLVVTVPTTNVPVIAKHERHYDLPRLTSHLGERFVVTEHRWLHRSTRLAEVLRKTMTNRFFGLHWPPARRAVTALYARRVLEADPGDGAHLLVVARPR